MTTTLNTPLDVEAQLRQVEPLVRRICRGRLGEVDGDDAAQRALVQVWRKLTGDEAIVCLPSYAATCARYETLWSYRDFARHATPSGDLAELLWADPDPGPDERAERAETAAEAAARIEALLAQLTPRQVEILRASVLADRRNHDAAALLGTTPWAVRAAQRDAMAHMRELCGTRSPNPRASNLPYAQRRGHRPTRRDRTDRLAEGHEFRAHETAAGWT